MTDITSRRRGRPAKTPDAVQGVTSDDALVTGSHPRRRRARVGGFNRKLDVPERPGYHRHWFNDVPGRLALAHELAYDFVEDRTLKSDSPDTRVRRHVGIIDGAPLYAYLMETPLEEYERGQREKIENTREVDKAIAAGRDLDGRIENQYGHGSIR